VPEIKSFLVALGAGLLIGIERERRKAESSARIAAGVRTFTICALLGAIVSATGLNALIVVAAIAVAALAALSYWRSSATDPGLTTEIALLATFALGVLAASSPALAAGLAVAIALLLAERSRLHAFAREGLSDRELADAILLAGAALIVLPLLPDRAIDPFGAVNPHLVWRLTVIVMLVNAAGYVALRTLGARWGLPIAGLLGGFVSSVATIAAMGKRSRDEPAQLYGALSGAALSSVSTVVQLALILAATNVTLLRTMALPLAAMALAAIAIGAWLSRRHLERTHTPEPPAGRAFDPKIALLFAAGLAVMLAAIALLQRAFGAAGLLGGAVAAGFLDTHGAAASVAALAQRGLASSTAGVIGVGLAVTANTATKIWATFTGGGAFARRLIPGLIVMLAALWISIAVAVAVPMR
jgi:uncharacterized membrane protein (DUF4010 family)